MVDLDRFAEAFPALRNYPSVRGTIETALSCLRDLLERSVPLTSYHAVILANNVSILDTRVAPSTSSEGLDFDYEHSTLGRVRLRFFPVDSSQPDLSDKIAGYADAVFATLSQLFEGQVLSWKASIALAHELSIQLVGIGLLAEELQNDEDLERAETFSSKRETLQLLKTQSIISLYYIRSYLASTAQGIPTSSRSAEIIDLVELLREIIALLSAQLKNRNLTISMKTMASTISPRVRGNGSELRLAIFVVIENAIRYAARGSQINVEILDPYDPDPRRRRVAVRVENIGPPTLGTEEISKVFQPGFRGSSAVASVPMGSGAGLAAAERIMRGFDGSIRFRSRPTHTNEEASQNFTTVDLVFPSAEA